MELTARIEKQEQRTKPRIQCNYLARVRGHDAEGKEFVENARVINFSRSGLYVLAGRSFHPGHELSVKIALPTGSLEWETSQLETHGSVVRSEPHSTGEFGIAIKLKGYKFL